MIFVRSSWEQNFKVFFSSIDLKKAYDCSGEIIWLNLRVPDLIVDIMTKLQLNGIITEKINVWNGLKQGSPCQQ